MRLCFQVYTMHCAACANAIERCVRKVPGTADICVNLGSGTLTLEADPEKFSKSLLLERVRGIGFELRDTEDGEADTLLQEEIREKKENRTQLRRLITALSASLLLTYISMHAMFHLPFFPCPPVLKVGLQLLLLGIILAAGKDFFIRGFRGLFKGIPGMDTLVALCSTTSTLYSLYLFLVSGAEKHFYFDSAGMVIALVMLGKTLEKLTRQRASGAIRALMHLTPETACVLDAEEEESVIPARDLQKGQIIRVRPGERIPADGIVTGGEAVVDESMLTGESTPVRKSESSSVIGGSVNLNGTFLCKVTHTGRESVASRIIELVRTAQGSKPPAARIADQVSGYFVWTVMGISFLTFCVWFFLVKTPLWDALEFALSVLVVACPCALGLATPIAIIAGIGRGASLGLLIKDAASLELAGRISVMVFDKTGTLTEGKPSVKNLYPAPGVTEEELLKICAGAELLCTHPLGNAIVTEARQRKLPLKKAFSPEEIPGMGLRCKTADGTDLLLGNDALMRQYAIEYTHVTEDGSTVYAAQANHFLGAILIGDRLKADAPSAIAELQQKGIRCLMFTGDNARSASAAAGQTGIRHFIAGMLPQDKFEKIRDLQAQGEIVAMTGDGINDGPALTQAHVGISLAGGTSAAMESAQIVLMRKDLSGVVSVLALSKAVMRVIHQNLFWAFFYNIICIPLAAGVFYQYLGWKLTPGTCCCAMAASSLCVVLNALRLRRFRG